MQMIGCSFELNADYNSTSPTPFWQNNISHTPISTHFPKEKNGHTRKKAIANGSQTSKHVVYKFWKIRSTCEFREQKGTKTWLASRNSHATVLGLLASNNMAKKRREWPLLKATFESFSWTKTDEIRPQVTPTSEPGNNWCPGTTGWRIKGGWWQETLQQKPNWWMVAIQLVAVRDSQWWGNKALGENT